MKLLNRLERRFAPLAVPHLTLYLIFFQSVLWLFLNVRPDLFAKIVLDRDLVLQGQIYRLLAFAFIPPAKNPFFLFFALSIFYMMGTALENQWGMFRYNVYLLVGYLATVGSVMFFPGGVATNAYVMASVLLAFAQLYPDFPILLFFILPVKVKYLGLLAWFGYLIGFLNGDWAHRAQIIAAIANFVLFFHADIRDGIRSSRRKLKVAATKSGPRPGEAFHTCVVCGANDITNRTMEFRYCPECKGTPCYCIEHISNHVHRQS